MLTRVIKRLMKGISGYGNFGEGDGMKITGCKGTVTINGKTYEGNNISIQASRIIIDGEVQSGSPLVGYITVNVTGDVTEVSTTSGDVNVQGDVGSVSTTSGDVDCENVRGDVDTTSGDVTVRGSIQGNVDTTSGDIIGGKK